MASSVTHVEGTLEIGALSPVGLVDLDRARSECAEAVSVEAAYAALGKLAAKTLKRKGLGSQRKSDLRRVRCFLSAGVVEWQTQGTQNPPPARV